MGCCDRFRDQEDGGWAIWDRDVMEYWLTHEQKGNIGCHHMRCYGNSGWDHRSIRIQEQCDLDGFEIGVPSKMVKKNVNSVPPHA